MNDPYQTLGVAKTASQAEIKSAYRSLALLHHPDKGGDPQVFHKISEAYTVLRNPAEKEVVPDLDSLFQSGLGFVFKAAFHRVRKSLEKSAPITVNAHVSLEQICKREKVSLDVTRRIICGCQRSEDPILTCATCGGRGRVMRYGVSRRAPEVATIVNCGACGGAGKHRKFCDSCDLGEVRDTLRVNFVPPISPKNSHTLSFLGCGNAVPGRAPGDLFVTILVKEHPLFSRNGKNLVWVRQTSLKEALCGYEDSVRHPNGRKLRVSFSSVDPDQEIRFQGKGLDSEGFLIVHHRITYPILREDQKQALSRILDG